MTDSSSSLTIQQFPASGDKALCSDKEDAYKHAADYIERKAGKVKSVGTLTKEEWEAAGLYVAFVFEKCPPKSSGDEGSGRGERLEGFTSIGSNIYEAG